MSAGPSQRAAWVLANGRTVSLRSPAIMGILNVTPDSFADGGLLTDVACAVDHAARLVSEGATILDIGGESTRPGASRVGVAEQIARVVPVVRAIRAQQGPHARIAISVDTTLPDVARAAIDAGADAINDVSGGLESLHDDASAMHTLAARTGAGLVLMHRLCPPASDSFSDRYTKPPEYGDVVDVVRGELGTLAARAERSGVRRDAMAIDPGLGFGKSVADNMALIRRTSEFMSLGFPLVSGISRKSFVGRVGLWRDSEPGERLAATVALSLFHARRGAAVLRVHDVGAHAAALESGVEIKGVSPPGL